MLAGAVDPEAYEEAVDKMLQTLIDQMRDCGSERFAPGDHVMLMYLEKQVELNGEHGVVIPSSKPDRVGVRLHCGRTLEVRPRNAFSGGLLTKQTLVPDCQPFYKYCAVQEEENKGLGVVATQLLRAGTVLTDPTLYGHRVNSVMLRPSCEGRMWTTDCYLAQARVGNVAVWEGGLQAVHDAIEATLVEVGYNCSHDARFTAPMCTLGACSYCGPSGLTVAASHGLQMPVFELPQHHLNVGRLNLAHNPTQLLAFLQPIDILYFANAIIVGLREVPLDDAVRAAFVEYAWASLSTWVANGFYSCMTVDDMRAAHDHTWSVVRRLHLAHLSGWRKWALEAEQAEHKPSALEAQMKLVQARYNATFEILLQRDTPEAPILGSGTRQSFDHFCVLELYDAPISRLNGAIPGTADRVNVVKNHHMVTPPGSTPDFLRDKITTLTVTEDVPAGAFLALSYNPDLAEDSQDGYFMATSRPFLLATRCREHAGLRAVVAHILASCGPLLSQAVRSHLEACARAP
jgi:hypothetical protein